MFSRLIDDARFRYAIVLAVCAVLYWPLLGTPGFGSSEGHRVVPAWTMLENADWFHIDMFGATYLRKPPGFPWAIAFSTAFFGHSEFAARAVSAASCTVMAVVALWFGSRWFGKRASIAAGIAQAITPQFVSIGRIAEIDALNAVGTQLACLALIDLLVRRNDDDTAPAHRNLGMMLTCALGVIIAALAKGPASLTCLLAIPVAAGVMLRSVRRLFAPRAIVPLLLAAVVLAPMAWVILRANPVGDAVTQDFSEFTWSLSRVWGALAFIPGAFVAGLPASSALLLPTIERLRRASPARPEQGPQLAPPREYLLAHTLALAWLLAVAMLMFAGISNARYAMPAATLLAPLAAYLINACLLPVAKPTDSKTRGLPRRDLARLLAAGHPLVIPTLLIPLLLWWSVWRETYRERREEGRRAGAAIAAMLPDDAEVWANDLIEARPDVLLYAQLKKRERGEDVTPLWKKPAMLKGELPDVSRKAPQFLLLRADANSAEYMRYRSRIEGEKESEHAPPPPLKEIGRGRVASYEFVVLRVLPNSEADSERP